MSHAISQFVLISQTDRGSFQVWDISSFKCVQTIHDDTVHYPDNQLTAAAIDKRSRRVVTVGSVLCTWSVVGHYPPPHNHQFSNKPPIGHKPWVKLPPNDHNRSVDTTPERVFAIGRPD